MKMRLKNMCSKVSNFFNNTIEFISLKSEVNILQKELEESKKKEKPYIDMIQRLKSDNRVLKILNTKSEKRKKELEETIKTLEKKLKQYENKLFKE